MFSDKLILNFLSCEHNDHPVDSMSERVKPIEEDKLMPEPFSNDAAERPSSTDNSSSQSTIADETSELYQGLVASSNASVQIQAIKKATVIPKYSFLRLTVGF